MATLTRSQLEHQVDDTVHAIHREQATKKALAIGLLVAGIFALLGFTYAMYTSGDDARAPVQNVEPMR